MSSPSAEAIPQELKVRRAATLAAWLGIAHALLVLVSYAMLSLAPAPSASDEEFASFYTSGDRGWVIVAGLYLMPFAGIAFLWFVVMLRMWISRFAGRVDALLSNVQLVSGIVFLGLFFAGAAALSALAASAEFSTVPADPATARQFTQLGWALLLVFAMRMAAIFIFTTSALGRRHRFLPRWFVIVGYAVGAFLLLSASLAAFLILVMPVWLLILGLFLLARARSLPAAGRLEPDGAEAEAGLSEP
jgi:hypothetical protein